MSDPVVQMYSGKSERTMQASHSVWMAHWTRGNVDAALQKQSRSYSSCGEKESDHDTKEYQSMNKLEITSNISNRAKGLKRIGTGSLELANESLRMTSTTITNENLPTSTPGQNGRSSSALKENRAACDMEAMMLQINQNLDDDISTWQMPRSFIPLLRKTPDSNDTPSRECHSESDGPPHDAKEPVKTLTVFRDSGFAMSGPWPEDFTASASQTQQCGFGNKNRISVLSSVMGTPASTSKEELQHTNMRFFESEKVDYQRHSSFLVCEEKIESHLKSERSIISCLQKNKMPLLQTDPLTNNNHPPAIGGAHIRKREDFSGTGFFQNQSKLSQATKSEKLHLSYNSCPKFMHSHHDMETMRICTTVDSVVGVRGAHPRISQTTDSWLITDNTDFNLFKGNSRNSRGFAELNRNAVGDPQSLSPPLWQVQQGVKLQSLSSFTGSEKKEHADDGNVLRVNAEEKNVEDVKVFGNPMDSKGKNIEHDMISDFDLKNESSADTDTMDLNDFEEKNWLSGVNSSSSKKVIKLGSIAPEISLGSAREAGNGQRKAVLPDMNLELPAIPEPADMLDIGEPSMSRTQSLDMETVLTHAEQLSHSESDRYFGGSAKPEPRSRWVKRLKLSTSDPLALGTKSSNLGEEIPHENNILFSQRIDMAYSEPTVSRHHGKELMVLDKTIASMDRDEPSLMDTEKKGIDLLISNSWIRRWRHPRAATPQKKHEAVVVCEPQSSKLAFKDLKEKQCPSIAAMALMGKALSGFQPCEFQNRGSFVVWNNRGP